MFTGVRVSNLRAIADSGPLELPSLCLLTGPNSSGKTSLLDSLLVARQTVDSRDQQLPLVVNGSYVDLGDYGDLIHHHDVSRNLSVEYEFELPRHGFIRFAALPPNAKTVRLRAEFKYNKKTFQAYPVSVEYSLPGTDISITKIRIDRLRSRLQIRRGSTQTARRTVETASQFHVLTVQYFRFSGQEEIAELIWALPAIFEDAVRRMFYLGPFRERPRRFYTATLETPQDVGVRGETAPQAIWAANRTVKERRRVLHRINHWLRKIGVSDDLQVRRIRGSYFSLTVVDPQSHVESSLADVGFGVSQVLPVVVQTAFVKPRSTLIFEQPEIHLHPAAQLELGDMFVDTAVSGNQVLVETHSEHLIRRVQTRIASGSIKPSDVGIYYIANSEDGAQFTRIGIGEDGRFTEIPAGFFDQGLGESIRHVEEMEKHASRR